MSSVDPPPAAIPPPSAGLSDRDWRKILRDSHDGKVIPVIRPELVTLPDPETGEIVPLNRFLAPRLEAVLGLADAERFTRVNAVACERLLNGGSRADIYDALREILDHRDSPPNSDFLDLARITDFHLIISSVFDHQLAKALTIPHGNISVDFNPQNYTLPRLYCRALAFVASLARFP